MTRRAIESRFGGYGGSIPLSCTSSLAYPRVSYLFCDRPRRDDRQRINVPNPTMLLIPAANGPPLLPSLPRNREHRGGRHGNVQDSPGGPAGAADRAPFHHRAFDPRHCWGRRPGSGERMVVPPRISRYRRRAHWPNPEMNQGAPTCLAFLPLFWECASIILPKASRHAEFGLPRGRYFVLHIFLPFLAVEPCVTHFHRYVLQPSALVFSSPGRLNEPDPSPFCFGYLTLRAGTNYL